uniref:RRM domain-containing protein n=1 Tax=Acrobeloides nanus TaxID=290746 RepID=A0A914D6U7_9BILA
MDGSSGMQYIKPKAMFQTLRRLHGHNLENKGLNNLSEAFNNFITRARFFSIGHLRRTWSHSAVEFMKYRRLLPMLVADEGDPGCSLFDDFDINPGLSFKDHRAEDRKVTVTNISSRVTSSQLQSFMGKFGKVQTCHIPSEDRRATSFYGTLPKNPKKFTMAHVTFK